MEISRHFETSRLRELREVAQIRILILDLDNLVRTLEIDIANEEKRAGIRDRFNTAYPILARTLTDRRANLKVTIAALEERLAKITEVLPEAVETAA